MSKSLNNLNSKKYRIAINGFGRIGRCLLRLFLENYEKPIWENIEIIAVNGPNLTPENAAHFLKYDSTHGVLPFNITFNHENSSIKAEISASQEIFADSEAIKTINSLKNEIATLKTINYNDYIAKIDAITEKLSQNSAQNTIDIQILSERDPTKINWHALDIDLVIETSGKFTSHKEASIHLQQGAKHVIIGSPAHEADFTCILGVNESALNPEKHRIISLGSCTTNCLAPLLRIMHDAFTIKYGVATTIHAYTNDQNLLDASHKDLRRSRAAAQSIIPSATGLNSALSKVLPELADRIQGSAFRVPVANVSIVDFSFTSEKKMDHSLINTEIKNFANKNSKILKISDLPLVSVDFNHSSYSCIYDASLTQIITPTAARISAWYDNEWGFSNRLLDLAAKIGASN
jgi:glyceraldehyde 3-phosphate dehydrogenase